MDNVNNDITDEFNSSNIPENDDNNDSVGGRTANTKYFLQHY